MLVDIYKVKRASNPNELVYLFVQAGRKPSELPSEITDPLGELIFEKCLDIQSGQKRIALDTDQAIQDLELDGYYIARVTFEHEVTPV
ncbi:MAG TPA: YcgL domain-containing protein [Candidatus Hydrogenedentes bacterium]|nr:YcgL domain-containing protein [Candidatus Hydrogenedentota bacterium]